MVLEVSEIKNAVSDIADEYGIRKIFLFGSYAKKNAADDSDIDIRIEKGMPLSLLDISLLRQLISEKTGKEVDIITELGDDEEFNEEILSSEVLLYEQKR